MRICPISPVCRTWVPPQGADDVVADLDHPQPANAARNQVQDGPFFCDLPLKDLAILLVDCEGDRGVDGLSGPQVRCYFCRLHAIRRTTATTTDDATRMPARRKKSDATHEGVIRCFKTMTSIVRFEWA